MTLSAAVLSAEWYFADTAAKTSPWSALARMVVWCSRTGHSSTDPDVLRDRVLPILSLNRLIRIFHP
jgi:hypothetical protein